MGRSSSVVNGLIAFVFNGLILLSAWQCWGSYFKQLSATITSYIPLKVIELHLESIKLLSKVTLVCLRQNTAINFIFLLSFPQT